MSEKQRMWLTAEGKQTTEQEMLGWVKGEHADVLGGSKLYVGTDSHLHGREFRFITVVCIYNKGRGGNYLYTTSYEKRDAYKGNQKKRMFREVELSIAMADFLLESLDLVSEIHIDASPKEAKEFTSSFSDQLVGYAVGSGYHAEIKPKSFAATDVADRHTK